MLNLCIVQISKLNKNEIMTNYYINFFKVFTNLTPLYFYNCINNMYVGVLLCVESAFIYIFWIYVLSIRFSMSFHFCQWKLKKYISNKESGKIVFHINIGTLLY